MFFVFLNKPFATCVSAKSVFDQQKSSSQKESYSLYLRHYESIRR